MCVSVWHGTSPAPVSWMICPGSMVSLGPLIATTRHSTLERGPCRFAVSMVLSMVPIPASSGLIRNVFDVLTSISSRRGRHPHRSSQRRQRRQRSTSPRARIATPISDIKFHDTVCATPGWAKCQAARKGELAQRAGLAMQAKRPCPSQTAPEAKSHPTRARTLQEAGLLTPAYPRLSLA